MTTLGDIPGSDPEADFDGSDYRREHDHTRLTGQIQRVYRCMVDGRWRTLSEIESATGDPAASISAQLRNLRKAKFGSHQIVKRARGDRAAGLWEYRLVPPGAAAQEAAA